MTRKCDHCGEEFPVATTRGRPRRSCDVDCAHAIRMEHARQRYDAARQLGASAVVAARCATSSRARAALLADEGLSQSSGDRAECTTGDRQPSVSG